jgi:RNA polymerase sigma-70 factor (ECF subfamily)
MFDVDDSGTPMVSASGVGASATPLPVQRGAMADRRGDAFRALTAPELEAAYRLAAVVLGDRAEAEDVVHDAVVQAWARFGSLRDPERFEAWFGRILLNGCRDRLRRRRRRPIADLDVAGDRASGPIDSVEPGGSTADREAIERAFERLEPDHRIVLALRFWRDLPVAGIAARLGIPEGTVKSRLHHATRRLRVELERDGWDE